MTLKEQRAALAELKKSTGWSLVQSAIQAELLKRAQELGTNKPMPHDEITFTRGAIWAAGRMLTIPDLLATKIDNEILMQEHANRPATAGQGE